MEIKHTDFIEELAKLPASQITDYDVDIAAEAIPFPMQSPGGTVNFGRVITAAVSKGTKHHNVCIGYVPGSENVVVWCGATYLEKDTFTQEAIDRAVEDAIAIGEISADDGEELTEHMNSIRGSHTQSTGCNFWRNGQSCKHTKGVLRQIYDSGLADDVIAALDMPMGNPAPETTKDDESDPLVSTLASYAFKKHILLEGDKGSGKTFGILAYLREQGCSVIEMHGHEGVEAIDMLGYDVRAGHDMVWKDGRISQAFRRAASGEKVALMIDEIARIPSRQLNILVSALSPNDRGEFVLPTGRMIDVVDGIGVEETLVVPRENLWTLGTMNVGMDYDVDDLDEALTDRFRTFRKDSDEDTINRVLRKECKSRKFKVSIATKLVSFWKKAERLRKQGELNRKVNMRHLCEAIELADNEEDVFTKLAETKLNWVGRDSDGYPLEGQIKLLEKILPKA